MVVLLLMATLLAAFVFGRSVSQASSEAQSVPAPTRVVVAPGDTLWSLAERVAPDRDPREVVAQIRRLNHLPTSVVQAGEQLLLPVAV